jgi:hypothetical protein
LNLSIATSAELVRLCFTFALAQEDIDGAASPCTSPAVPGDIFALRPILATRASKKLRKAPMIFRLLGGYTR